MNKHGYTIIEVMIFLAVTGGLLTGALLAVNGQQNRTEFSQASRELESNIRDVINDVSTGFYPDTGNVGCSAGATVILSSSASPQGENSDCTFVGRVLQFRPDGKGRLLRIYTMAGRRRTTSIPPREVVSLVEAAPALVARSATQGSAPDAFQDIDIGPITVSKASYIDSTGVRHSIGGFGIFTTFRGYTGLSLDSGSSSANTAPLASTALDEDSYTFANGANTDVNNPSLPINPRGGIEICMFNDSTNQHAVVSIGGNASALTTNLTFSSGVCP